MNVADRTPNNAPAVLIAYAIDTRDADFDDADVDAERRIESPAIQFAICGSVKPSAVVAGSNRQKQNVALEAICTAGNGWFNHVVNGSLWPRDNNDGKTKAQAETTSSANP
jgi:hypothetical protein